MLEVERKLRGEFVTVGVRLTRAEREDLELLARHHRTTMSEVLRAMIRREVEEVQGTA